MSDEDDAGVSRWQLLAYVILSLWAGGLFHLSDKMRPPYISPKVELAFGFLFVGAIAVFYHPKSPTWKIVRWFS